MIEVNKVSMREKNGRMRSDPAARGDLTVETQHNSQPPLIQNPTTGFSDSNYQSLQHT